MRLKDMSSIELINRVEAERKREQERERELVEQEEQRKPRIRESKELDVQAGPWGGARWRHANATTRFRLGKGQR